MANEYAPLPHPCVVRSALAGWPGSTVVPGGQCRVCGLGPRANGHSRRAAYDMRVGAPLCPMVLLRHGMRRPLNPRARALKLVNVTAMYAPSSCATRPEQRELPIASPESWNRAFLLTLDERRLVRIRVGCEFHFDAALPVQAVVLLRARSDGGVTVERETWHVQPSASFSDLVDMYGNHARRVVIGAGKASLRYDAEVTTSAAAGRGQPRSGPAPGRGPAWRDPHLHASQPLLPLRHPVRRGLEPVRDDTAGMGAGAGRLQLGSH